MKPTIVLIAPGEMGSGIGRRLTRNGFAVRTSLRGRSAASATRAKSAGMVAIDEDAALLDGADIVLSVLPPGDARALAERLQPVLRQAKTKPLYADCNAIAPSTLKAVAAIVAPTGCPFVDIGIVGGPPPAEGAVSPRLYASGPAAKDLMALKEGGLDYRLLDGDIGVASALKMAYATLTKGTTAIAAAMMLGAMRSGSDKALREELAASQPALSGWALRQVPTMYSKAYRWVAEMDEIAKTLAEDPGAARMFDGAARLYEELARDFERRGGEGNAIDLLEAFRET